MSPSLHSPATSTGGSMTETTGSTGISVALTVIALGVAASLVGRYLLPGVALLLRTVYEVLVVGPAQYVGRLIGVSL